MKYLFLIFVLATSVACEDGFRSVSSVTSFSATGRSTGNNLPGLVCEESQHIETNACVSNLRDCNVTNGKGTEIWDGQQFGSCQITSCNSTFHKEGNACLSDLRVCVVANGGGEQMWDGAKYGACAVKMCNPTFHAENNMCAANVRSCDVANGKGEQAWDGAKYGACALVTCNSGYQNIGGACAVSLVGSYSSPCGIEGYDRIFTNNFIDASNHELITNFFDNLDSPGTCRTPSHEVRSVGSYTLVGMSATEPGAIEIDFVKTSTTFTLFSEERVRHFNGSEVCGKTDWKLRTPVVFTSGECFGTKIIRSVNKLANGKLYVGDYKGGKDFSVRPASVSLEPTRISSPSRVCAVNLGQGIQVSENGNFGACKPVVCDAGYIGTGNACGTSVTLTNLTLLTAGNIYYPLNDTRTPDHVKDYCRYFTGQTGMVNSRGTTENRVIQNFYASCSAAYAQSGCSPERYGDINYFSYNSPVTLSVYTSLTCAK